MDVVIRLRVRIEMHWPLFSIGTLKLNTSPDQGQDHNQKTHFQSLDDPEAVSETWDHNTTQTDTAVITLCYRDIYVYCVLSKPT